MHEIQNERNQMHGDKEISKEKKLSTLTIYKQMMFGR